MDSSPTSVGMLPVKSLTRNSIETVMPFKCKDEIQTPVSSQSLLHSYASIHSPRSDARPISVGILPVSTFLPSKRCAMQISRCKVCIHNQHDELHAGIGYSQMPVSPATSSIGILPSNTFPLRSI